MENLAATKLIGATFNHKFDKNQFTLFIKNLLNDFEEKSNSYSGSGLWESHLDHINSYQRIGKYIDPNGDPLDVLVVNVKSVSKLEKARTALRSLVIKHLDKFEKDYALVAFYSNEDEGKNWRFSFIKLEYQPFYDEEKDRVKIKKEFTPAKRYSFLVGEDEKSYTAKSQLMPLLKNIISNPTIGELEDAFSIEKVTDEFFGQYKDLYVKLFEHFKSDKKLRAELKSSGIDSARFTKKLLGQIVFLYFLQKKGWLGVQKNEAWGTGKKRFIQDLFAESEKQKKNFFKDYLQYLFYEALAEERNNLDSFYYLFNCRIPFLNGGLFEAEYDWKKTNISIPTNLFRNNEKNKEGDEGTGILDVFDRYNFTIKEDEPLDKEVAVDPEMLGKVFENMLDVTERKSKGAFYTPREIVHYMCQESLIHYLDNVLNDYTDNFQEFGDQQSKLFGNETKVGQRTLEISNKVVEVEKRDIEKYIRRGHLTLEHDLRVSEKGETKTYQYELPESIRAKADLIDRKLTKIKICDPAIGSGAFPVGLLHELVTAHLVIKPHLTKEYTANKLKEFEFNPTERISESRYVYRLKRHIIQESIYGVDIDRSAIDIARLRLWLSLVVDEDDFDPIETLPNLDYKIVCGNSLLSKYALNTPIKDVFKELNKKITNDDFENKKLKEFLAGKEVNLELYQKLHTDFLTESNHDKKDLFRSFISEIKNAFVQQLDGNEIKEISNKRGKLYNLKQSDIFGKIQGSKAEIKKAKEQLSRVELKHQEKQAGELFKDSIEWRFEFPNLLNKKGDYQGFDVVIGNPPYVQIAKFDSKIKSAFASMGFETFSSTGDIYELFYENGNKLLKPYGHLCYITSNKWLRANYGENTRNYFLTKTNPKILLDFGQEMIFSTAIVHSNILLFQNAKYNNEFKGLTANHAELKGKTLDRYFKKNSIELDYLNKDVWAISTPELVSIKNRIEGFGVKLNKMEWKIKMNFGIKTGFNEAFIIDEIVKKELIKNNPELDEIIKPILRGRDTRRYYANFDNNYLLNTHNGDKNKGIPRIDVKKNFPHLLEYLESFPQKIRTRSDQGDDWTNLRNCAYLDEIEKDKIIFSEIVSGPQFYYDKDKYYPEATSFLITGDNLKWLIAFLNSELMTAVFKIFYAGGELVGKYRYKKSFLENLPVPLPIKKYENTVETLVDIISAYKGVKKDDSINNSTARFFESVLNALVFEICFEKEFEKADKQIWKHLQDLKTVNDNMEPAEQLAIIEREYLRLYNSEHPVRFVIETIESIDEVKTIKDALR